MERLQGFDVFDGEEVYRAVLIADDHDVFVVCREPHAGWGGLLPECHDLVLVVETPHADSLVITASGVVVGFDVTLVVFILGDDVERVDWREVGTNQADGSVFILVDLPNGAVDGRDETLLALVAQNYLTSRVVEQQDVRLAVEEHLSCGVHLTQFRVRLRVENRAVAANYAVLLEDSHLADDSALHAVS